MELDAGTKLLKLLEEGTPGAKEQAAPEPVEQIITLDEYVHQNNLNVDYLNSKNEVNHNHFENQDKTVKMMQPKVKEEVQYSKSKGSRNQVYHASNAGASLIPESATQPVRKASFKKGSQIKVSEKDFPPLS